MADLKTIHWGIIGAGDIASEFVSDFSFVKGAKLVGVSSRTPAKAHVFSERHHIPAFNSPLELLETSPDVVYIATPHPSHHALATLAIKTGVSVLCEKPFTTNKEQAASLVSLARSRQLFLMEGMWTRFIPAMRDIVRVIRSGGLGKLVSIEASFGCPASPEILPRLYSVASGGGSLLDLGVYCVSLAQMLLTTNPIRIKSKVTMGKTGVDLRAQWCLLFNDGIVAKGQSAIDLDLESCAIIRGTQGEIRIPQFWSPKTYSWNGINKTFEFPGLGLHFEAQEVTDCIRANRIESDIMPLSDTLAVMETLDQIRYSWPLRYPGETERLPSSRLDKIRAFLRKLIRKKNHGHLDSGPIRSGKDHAGQAGGHTSKIPRY